MSNDKYQALAVIWDYLDVVVGENGSKQTLDAIKREFISMPVLILSLMADFIQNNDGCKAKIREMKSGRGSGRIFGQPQPNQQWLSNEAIMALSTPFSTGNSSGSSQSEQQPRFTFGVQSFASFAGSSSSPFQFESAKKADE